MVIEETLDALIDNLDPDMEEAVAMTATDTIADLLLNGHADAVLQRIADELKEADASSLVACGVLCSLAIEIALANDDEALALRFADVIAEDPDQLCFEYPAYGYIKIMEETEDVATARQRSLIGTPVDQLRAFMDIAEFSNQTDDLEDVRFRAASLERVMDDVVDRTFAIHHAYRVLTVLTGSDDDFDAVIRTFGPYQAAIQRSDVLLEMLDQFADQAKAFLFKVGGTERNARYLDAITIPSLKTRINDLLVEQLTLLN